MSSRIAVDSWDTKQHLSHGGYQCFITLKSIFHTVHCCFFFIYDKNNETGDKLGTHNTITYSFNFCRMGQNKKPREFY